MFWPCETRTSTCRSFATISSGLYRFLAIAVLLDVKDIPQVGPLQWGWIIMMAVQKKEAREGLENAAMVIDVLEKIYQMDVTHLSPADVEAFRGKTPSVYTKWADNIGAELVHSTERIVERAK